MLTARQAALRTVLMAEQHVVGAGKLVLIGSEQRWFAFGRCLGGRTRARSTPLLKHDRRQDPKAHHDQVRACATHQRDVEKIVNAILGEIVAAMARGDRVELRGFGAFSIKQRPARTGRNPRTGAHVVVDQKCVPLFKTGKEMRERLNEGGDT